ncbi:MAG: cell envelope integrity protein CreD [bacterium]|nr:cell envelope integrity protein CreD [bacterium]
MTDTISIKVLAIGIIGVACFVASLLVMGLVEERQHRADEAKSEIAQGWGERQTIVGPMLIAEVSVVRGTSSYLEKAYVLPAILNYETVLEPEVRSRGIFKSVVYVSKVKVSGEFSPDDMRSLTSRGIYNATLAVEITDTRGIERQFDLNWRGTSFAFEPGSGFETLNSSGLHVAVPISGSAKIPFSFELKLKGSEGILIAPLGTETSLSIASLWPNPKFVGKFLPTSREITKDGFISEWHLSSLGRSYPATWQGEKLDLLQFAGSAAGVDLHPGIDTYDMVQRAVKYAILFIVLTFAAYFLFDVLAGVHVHPIQYLLVGSALALFYLLLLSLTEQIGFTPAYLLATTMIAFLITSYSAFVLKSRRRAFPIFALLTTLYAYLYFILHLEDYALIAGSLFLFMILAAVMYMTRNTDWFSLGKKE